MLVVSVVVTVGLVTVGRLVAGTVFEELVARTLELVAESKEIGAERADDSLVA
jgi:hypothetical protein